MGGTNRGGHGMKATISTCIYLVFIFYSSSNMSNFFTFFLGVWFYNRLQFQVFIYVFFVLVVNRIIIPSGAKLPFAKLGSTFHWAEVWSKKSYRPTDRPTDQPTIQKKSSIYVRISPKFLKPTNIFLWVSLVKLKVF